MKDKYKLSCLLKDMLTRELDFYEDTANAMVLVSIDLDKKRIEIS